MFLPLLTMVGIDISDRRKLDHVPPHQIVGDEICVNYICHSGTVKVAIVNDSVMHITRGDRFIEPIPIKKVVIIKGRYFFHFEYNRGFFVVGPYDHNAFMYLDKNEVVIHIKHSTFRQ